MALKPFLGSFLDLTLGHQSKTVRETNELGQEGAVAGGRLASCQRRGCSKAMKCLSSGQLSRYGRTREAFHTHARVFVCSFPPNNFVKPSNAWYASPRMGFGREWC